MMGNPTLLRLLRRMATSMDTISTQSETEPTELNPRTTCSFPSKLAQSLFGRTACGKEEWKKNFENAYGENVGLYVHQKSQLCFSVHVDDVRMVGKKQILGRMWNILRKGMGLGDPVPLLNQVYLDCTQREAEVEHEAVQAEADLFRRITSAEVANKKQDTKEKQLVSRSQRGVTTWQDMLKSAMKGIVSLLEKVRQHWSWRKRHAWMITIFCP